MQSETRFTARYAETDQMGVIHHANYIIWFEAGRTDFLKQTGISYSDIEAKGVMLPLYELNCRYKSPARYEDEILVITELKQLARVRVLFSYQVKDARSGKLFTEGETMHAWTDRTLKPVNAEKAIPDIYAILKNYSLKGE